jgi:hypothetical protein
VRRSATAFGGSQPPLLAESHASSTQIGSRSESKSEPRPRDHREAMSQVEHGKHGGRKQKKRKTGF